MEAVNITLNTLAIEVRGNVTVDNMEALVLVHVRERIQQLVSDAIRVGDEVGTWTFKFGDLEPVEVHRHHHGSEGIALVLKDCPVCGCPQ
jgi:hypothetical protein